MSAPRLALECARAQTLRQAGNISGVNGLDQQKLADVLKPVELAHGLAYEHYISDEVFQIEKQKVLFDTGPALVLPRMYRKVATPCR